MTELDAALKSIPGTAALSNRAHDRLRRATGSLLRFAAHDAAVCPNGLRPGYTVAEWVALGADARRTYLLAVLVTREVRTASGSQRR